MRPNRIDIEDRDAGNVTLPRDLQDAILSWGRILATGNRDHKRARYAEAVGELLLLAKTKGEPVHQAVVDRLQQIALAHNIGADEAQAIMAGARSRDANGHDAGSEILRHRDGLAGTPQPAPRFIPVAIDDVEMPTEPAWLIDGILPARGLVYIVGPPKCGKSYFASDMFCTVARGALYAGQRTMQGPVIYLTGEGVNGFKRRLIAMRRHLGIEGQNTPFFMIDRVPDLGSEKTNLPQLLADLEAFIAQNCLQGPRVIVLDTLARCMGEADENSARDMMRFVNRCAEIERHFGCVVAVVHHMGKDPTKGARGSNAQNGAVDITLTVTKSDGFSTVRVDESKDGPEGAEWRFRLLPYLLTETSEPPSETSSEVSVCVVEILSEPTAPKPRETSKPKQPKGVAGDLLKVIRRAVEDAGECNVDSVAVPNNVHAVSRANLKRYCATMDWQDPDGKPDGFRSMLSKNLSALRAENLIGFDRDWVWLT